MFTRGLGLNYSNCANSKFMVKEGVLQKEFLYTFTKCFIIYKLIHMLISVILLRVLVTATQSVSHIRSFQLFPELLYISIQLYAFSKKEKLSALRFIG